MPNYGLRPDGTPKGTGYLGELKRPGGGISSELTVGVGKSDVLGEGYPDDEEIYIPAIVPTLTKKEIDYLLSGGKITREITRKAVIHAQKRIKQGKSPYAEEGENFSVPLDETGGPLYKVLNNY